MKKIDVNHYGLLPLYLSDAEFMQEALQEQIEAILKPYLPYTSNSSFIISGIEPDDSSSVADAYTGGWIVIEGKLYYVAPFVSSVPDAEHYRRWVIDTVFLLTGTKMPKRTTSVVETHKLLTARVETTITPAGTPFDLPRFASIITKMQMPTYFERNGSNYRLQFLQLPNGYVHVVGELNPDAGELCNSSPLILGETHIAVDVPFVLAPSFKPIFAYKNNLTIFMPNEMGISAEQHKPYTYSAVVSFVASEIFTFSIYVDEIPNGGFSSLHHTNIPISIILKVQ